MVNYVCAFSQSESGKYFEWIINIIIMLESLPPFLLRSNSSPSLHVWLRARNKKALSSCKLCQCHFWGARETRSAKYRELPKLPNMFHNKVYVKNQNILFWTYQEPYFKGAVLQHSSSFCLILSITRPQWLWNLKSAKKLHVNDKIRDPR